MPSKKVIVLDAGHGGSDPGAVGNNMREADITLALTGLLRHELEKAGFTVILSRPRADVNPGIHSRWRLANEHRADYFLSVHVNAGGGTGVETFYYRDGTERSRKSETFARCVNDTFAQGMGLRNRGVKPDTLTHHGAIGVLRQTTMPAILVELAFIDSPLTNTDVFILGNRRGDMAYALAKGVCGYFGTEPTPMTGVSINPANNHVIRGTGKQFTANVTQTGGVSTSVKWSVQGANESIISKTGYLLISGNEPAGSSFKVRATSKSDHSVFGEATVTVVSDKRNECFVMT
jgi:N-acetylmuramoyl-L-alanine amidase